MRHEISAKAADDIRDIIRYTFENFGRAQVDEYLDGLYNSFDVLEDNPKMGRTYKSESSVRFYIYRMHYVFYAIQDDIIRIAHIRHSAMKRPSETELRIEGLGRQD